MNVSLVDMDEVVVSLLDSWLETYHQIIEAQGLDPCPMRRGDIKTYHQMDSLPFKYREIWWKAIDRAPGMRVAKPFPGAVEALRRLYEATDCYILTYARHESWGRAHEAKLAFMWQWAPWFDRNHVIFTRDKHLVRGDVLFEDSAANVHKWLGATQDPWVRAYLIEQPWNENDFFEDRRCRHAKSFAHAVDCYLGGMEHAA